MRVEVVPPDPQWTSMFATEAALLWPALGDLDARIHHIGSTAIPGIHAKPVIDILLEVSDIDALDERTPALEKIGYEAKGEFGIPGRRYFSKDAAGGVRTHQIHAFEKTNSGIQRHLAFRDYMTANPELAQEYSDLKRRLAAQFPDDIEAYMDGKDPFIKKHERAALHWVAAARKPDGES